MSARQLSRTQKLGILNAIRQSGTIALSCREAGISRSTYYLWLSSLGKRASNTGDFSKNNISHGIKREYKKISIDTARKIIKLAVSEPDYSIRKIASSLGVSTGYAWKKLKEKELTTRVDRLRYRNLRGENIYPEVAEATKFSVIYKYKNGLSVSHISRSMGISRTTIYKWLNAYDNSKGSLSALNSKRPRSDSHWNYKKGVEQILLDIITQKPDTSLDDLCVQVNSYSSFTISRSGLYYILRKLNLNKVIDRVKYAETQAQVSNQNSQTPIINKIDRPIQTSNSYLNILPIISPRLLVYLASVSFISVLILLSLVYIPPSMLPTDINPLTTSDKIVSRKVTNFKSPETLSGWKKLKPIYSTYDTDLSNGTFISNTNKSIYTKGEKAKISLGILNAVGTTVCNSKIELEIISPDNKKVSLSTDGGGVTTNSDCSGNSYVKDPDYAAEIKTGKPGIYKIIAISNSESVNKQVEDAFYVAPQAPFDIDRSGFPTRVYPVSEYAVSLKIKPRQDFKGEISEELPSGFNVGSSSASIKIIENGNKLLTWKADWKKGKEYKLSYTIKFPSKSPAVYAIEPLTISSGDYVVFEELKSWKISVDSIN